MYSCCMILYTCRAHQQALFITVVALVRGEEEAVGLLSVSYCTHQTINNPLHLIYNIYIIAVPYLVRSCMYLVLMERQQLQQQHYPRKKKMQWYCYFYIVPIDKILFITPDMYNTDSDIITNSRYTVIRVSSYLYQHDTIIQNNQKHHPGVRLYLE